MDLRERRKDFLGSGGSLCSSGLGLLVKFWENFILIGTEVEGIEESEVAFGDRVGLSEVAYEDGGSVTKLRVGDDENSARSPSVGEVPSNVVYVVHIFIRALS